MAQKNFTTVLWAMPIALALAFASSWWARPPQISASLYDLVGNASLRMPKFLRETSEREISVIVSNADGSKAAATAKDIAQRLANAGIGTHDQTHCDGMTVCGQFADDEAAMSFFRHHRGGLVAPETATLLRTGAGRKKIAQRAWRRLFGSPMPPLLGYADDPFGLADGFLATLVPSAVRKSADGFQTIVTNGITHILIRRRLDDSVAGNIEKTIALCERLRRACAPSSSGTTVRLAGVPVHSAISASRSKREISALTWFSLAVIAALALFAFRSWRWLPLLTGSLVVSALAGGLALILCFRELHVLTLVMGTTVLGLVIDYSFHWLLSPDASKSSVKRNLLVSFATTEISLIPLMLSSIPVLRQSALFLGIGLAASLAYVWTGYPTTPLANPARTVGTPRGSWRNCAGSAARRIFVLAALAACVGLCRVSLKTNATSLYHPPDELLEAEKIHALFTSFGSVSIPTQAERLRIAKDVDALYAEHGAAMAKTLGIDSLTPPPAPAEPLLRPKELIDGILAAWTAESLKRLGLSVVALAVVLTVLCRKRTLLLMTPPLTAIFVVAGILGWAGIAVNLFHLLASFLLLGMGIDYAVFLESGDRSSFKPALCSLFTSIAGFGALAFVSFPVVQSFGVTLGIGLPVAFVTAMAMGRKSSASPGVDPHERAASLLGMEILFLTYRFCGLTVLHCLASAVGALAWCFSPAVRHSSPSLRKVISFSLSLADKLVVMADGRRLPAVKLDPSPDAAAFISDVKCGKGVFILSSHVGTIEVLTALGECNRTFHAWMDIGRTEVFNRFYLRHARRRKVVIHPIAEFGMQTVFAAGDAIDAGDCLIMAGDRGDGSFRFAAAFDHPVYFVACIAESGSGYRVVVRRLPSERNSMAEAFRTVLTELASRNPEQHFVWEA